MCLFVFMFNYKYIPLISKCLLSDEMDGSWDMPFYEVEQKMRAERWYKLVLKPLNFAMKRI